MGGNNALIVQDFTNQDQMIHHIIASAFISAGQRCSCARRLIIHNKHLDLLEPLLKRISTLPISNYPSKKEPFMGPVVLGNIKSLLLKHRFKQTQTLLKSLIWVWWVG